MDLGAMKGRELRLLECLPVVAALFVNGTAHVRLVPNLVVMGGLVLAVLLGFKTPHRGGRMLLVGAVGGALGFAGFLLAPPPQGPIPPVVLSPLCFGLVGLSAYCVLSENRPFAWVYAWLLAVLSANVPLTLDVMVALGALALATVVGVAAAGRLVRGGLAGVLGFAAFTAVAAVATWQLTLLIRASEGWLMESLATLTNGSGVRALEPKSVNLPARTTAPLSMDPLFELEGPPPHYLRTGVLEYFDGRTWWEAQSRREEKLAMPGGTGQALAVNFLAPLGKSIPAPAGVLSAQGATVEVRGGWVLQSDDAAGRTVQLVRGPEVLPEEAPPTDAERALPDEVAKELAPLAGDLLGSAATPRARAEALEQYFSKNFTYSLTVDLKGAGHPLAVLIRERRAAYCSYFASAMVSLLRTQGVAARLVTGFAPGETNRFTGRTLVRSRDAHAWVEVYLPEEKRWAAFDPTPWSTRDAALLVQRHQSGFADALDVVLSALRRAWAMIRYTPGAALLAVATSPVTWVLVAAVALFVFRRRLTFRRRAKREAFVAEVDPRLLAVRTTYDKLLARAGLTVAPHETDDEVLVRLRETNPAAAAAAERFVRAFQRERFRAPEQAPLHEALHALERELGRSP
jgi:hypothetical protein